MKKYTRITYEKRLQMEALLRTKLPKKEIAKTLGITLSSLYYEYHKGTYTHLNSDYTTTTRYSADIAQRKADFNRTAQGKQIKLGNDYEFAKFVEHKIKKEKYSPNAVLLYIKTHNLQFKTTICRTTLYNYIYGGVLCLSAKDLLRKGQRKRHRTPQKPKTSPFGISIDQRPNIVAQRQQFGHWEMDSIVGKRNGKGQTLLCLTERKTRYEIIIRSTKESHSTVKALNALKRKYKKAFPHIFKTITCDNGAEFKTDKLTHTPVYYCHPYSSWERGSNENQNGFIRRFIPKSTPVETITDEQLQQIQDHINNYPRFIFNGATSRELFENELSKLKEAQE